MRRSRIIALILVVIMLFCLLSACSSHAPGYGKTNKCTICGKTATHKTSNYGYCDKHWKDMLNYQP